jgi:hypothetical protein
MRSCGPNAELVGGKLWLPVEAFEHGWASPVGCNRLRCTKCGEAVTSSVIGDGGSGGAGAVRRYRCGCAQRDESWRSSVAGDPDGVGPPATSWECAGHPVLELPCVLDGERLEEDADEAAWRELARRGLVTPPLVPPGLQLGAVWVTRLYRLLGSAEARRKLGEAVAQLVEDAGEEAAVRAEALEVFFNDPAAPGADRLAALVTTQRAALSGLAHPTRRKTSLLDALAQVLHERLLLVDGAGRPRDGAALAAAQQLALGGVGPSSAPYTFADHAPAWLWQHAAALVKARPRWLGYVVQGVPAATAAQRGPALREIAALGAEQAAALRAELAEVASGEALEALLREVEGDGDGDDGGGGARGGGGASWY